MINLNIYLLDLATRSNSSFFLIAYEFEEPFAALISSSAKHSAIVLMLRNAASLAPVQSNQIAWFTRRSGETSTAWRLTVPALPILVESSRGPELIIAVTKTWNKVWLWECDLLKWYLNDLYYLFFIKLKLFHLIIKVLYNDL